MTRLCVMRSTSHALLDVDFVHQPNTAAAAFGITSWHYCSGDVLVVPSTWQAMNDSQHHRLFSTASAESAILLRSNGLLGKA